MNGVYGGPFTPQTGIVLLHWGAPRNDLSVGFGTQLNNGPYASNADILAATKAFAQGYWDCRVGTPSIIIAIGTTNCGDGTGTSLCNPNGSNVTPDHGRSWAQLALDFQNWLVSKNFSGYLSSAGASDIELDWETATNSKNWVCVPATGGGCTNGFGAVIGAPLMYNFGDAAGCPPAGTCNNSWTQADIWYVSWGAPPSEPLPQIYNTAGTNARQWRQIKSYGVTAYGNRMDIKGSVTQRDACRTNPPCTGIDNTPQAGWTQMWKELNGAGAPDPNLVQQLPYSTDFTWDQQ